MGLSKWTMAHREYIQSCVKMNTKHSIVCFPSLCCIVFICRKKMRALISLLSLQHTFLDDWHLWKYSAEGEELYLSMCLGEPGQSLYVIIRSYFAFCFGWNNTSSHFHELWYFTQPHMLTWMLTFLKSWVSSKEIWTCTQISVV